MVLLELLTISGVAFFFVNPRAVQRLAYPVGYQAGRGLRFAREIQAMVHRASQGGNPLARVRTWEHTA